MAPTWGHFWGWWPILWGHFLVIFWDHFLVIFGVIFWTTFWSLFGPLLGAILGPIFGPDQPKRVQDEPKRAIKSFKDQKSYILKKVFFGLDCLHFFALEASQRTPKPQKKGIQNWPKNYQILNQFWVPKLLQKWSQKLVQKGTNNWTKTCFIIFHDQL